MLFLAKLAKLVARELVVAPSSIPRERSQEEASQEANKRRKHRKLARYYCFLRTSWATSPSSLVGGGVGASLN